MADKPRYRTRKNEIATNVLGVCSQDMQFIYVLSGWEGSAADGRVLRDAISREKGLVVPRGKIIITFNKNRKNCISLIKTNTGIYDVKVHIIWWMLDTQMVKGFLHHFEVKDTI